MRRPLCCCISCVGLGLHAGVAAAESPFAAIGAASSGERTVAWGARVTVGLLHRSAPSYRWALRGFLQRRAYLRLAGQDRYQAQDRETGLGLSWARRWSLAYRWHPWIGVESGFISVQRVNRYRISRQGYLVTPLTDTSGRGLFLGAVLDQEWRVVSGLIAGVSIEYQRDAVSSRNQFIISVTGRYRP